MKLNSSFKPTKALSYIKSKTPLGRMRTPQDIANGVMFLTSDHSSFITGQPLKIDSGLVI
ncbi:hypothetical protein CJF26_18965 [Photobacterium phosphoreum]|nr:hypothetical protein [Photobacterium phosphoreum]